jgi:asparagine N-glycosylation enzyme membrane subunit Stt3
VVAGRAHRSRALLVEAGAVVLDHEPVAALFGLGASVVGTLALSTRAEWAVRMPFVLFGVLGIYAVYLCVSRFVSRRAGVLAAVVTATCPLYALVARQAMTDMAFVGPMTMALALGALALFDDDDTPLPRREARSARAR